MAKASELMAVAIAEVGYCEKASNSNLDSKTGNAGYGNYTKYARDLDAIKFYNGAKNGYAWCDVFVDWCFYKAFGAEKAKELLCQPNRSLGAAVEYSSGYYKDKGRWSTKPSVGAQIFFCNSRGEMTHTGLVEACDNIYVYTIEGNTSNVSGVVSNGGSVCRKVYRRDSRYIVGYGVPAFDGEGSKATAAPAAKKETKTTNKEVCNVELPVLRKGDESGYVKTLQILLNKYNNAKLTEDGDFGNATLAAVRAYQQSRKLDVDGIVGAKTWAQLLK